MVRYSLLRILIFFGVMSALWLLGLRDRDEQLLLLVLSALISMAISVVALKRFREDYSQQLAERLERRAQAKQQRGSRADEQAEDAEDEGRDSPESRDSRDSRDNQESRDNGPVEYR